MSLTGALTTDRVADHHTQGDSSQTWSRVQGLSQTQGLRTGRMVDHSQGGVTHHHRHRASSQTGSRIEGSDDRQGLSQTGSRVEGLSQTQGLMTDRMADHTQGD